MNTTRVVFLVPGEWAGESRQPGAVVDVEETVASALIALRRVRPFTRDDRDQLINQDRARAMRILGRDGSRYWTATRVAIEPTHVRVVEPTPNPQPKPSRFVGGNPFRPR
jgi:hypothetical protein